MTSVRLVLLYGRCLRLTFNEAAHVVIVQVERVVVVVSGG
jgi:hypothetical protein